MILEPMCSQNQAQQTTVRKIGCHRAKSALAGAILAAWLPSCSPATSAAPKPSVAAATQPAAPQLRAPTNWAVVEGQSVPLRLRIPFASEWRRSDSRTSLRLEHTGEQCAIVARIWPASRIVDANACLDELALIEPEVALARRTWLVNLAEPITGSDDDTAVVAQAFEPGGDFHGFLRGAVLAPHAASMTATIVAVAAGVGRCIALVATTETPERNAEALLADRMAWLVEGVAKSVAIRSVQERIGAR